jgi:Carboxypeptidase activation peptide/Zinc carboxypeptidase
VTPNEDQYSAFAEWQFEDGADFWRLYSAGVRSTVMIAPHRQEDFEEFLDASQIIYNVAINDVEIVLEEERRNMTKNRRGKSTALPGMVPDFSVYWSSTEMEQYCSYLANTYPQLIQMETLIFSPGNRRIYAMKISNGVFGQKPIIAMEAGMHAREW